MDLLGFEICPGVKEGRLLVRIGEGEFDGLMKLI